MTIAHHFVARSQPNLKPLLDRNACVDLWRRLRRRFPDIAACILMPNHLHILVFTDRPKAAKWNLAIELRAWSRQFYPGNPQWLPIPPPAPIPDSHHLKRQIRYVHLNPCRAGLAQDPLEWEWSTHRDVTGGVVDPWPSLKKMANLLNKTSENLGETIHHYTSSDPTVSPAGSPPLRNLKPGETLVTHLPAILRASAQALRTEESHQRGRVRNLAIQTAEFLRMKREPQALNIKPLAWNRALKRPCTAASIRAVLRILADPRTR